jgi:hypothetical protein
LKNIALLLAIPAAIILLSFSIKSGDLPEEILGEWQEAHKHWLSVVKDVEDLSDRIQKTPSLSSLESSSLKPYPLFSISCEDLQNCTSGNEIISHLEIDRYRAPLFYEGRVEGFATIKLSSDSTKNVKKYYWKGFGDGAEKEKEYYSLLEQYPEYSGNKVYAFFFQYGRRKFFLVKTSNDHFLIMPASKMSKYFITRCQQQDTGYQLIPLDQVLDGLTKAAKQCSQIIYY